MPNLWALGGAFLAGKGSTDTVWMILVFVEKGVFRGLRGRLPVGIPGSCRTFEQWAGG